jgi:hypothetical protein
MQLSAIQPVAVAIVVGVTAACATTKVTVRKVAPADAKTAGIRYSLPKPFLLVVPNTAGDGGFTAKVVYLPDECQTYAIDARTRRGKYQLDVVTKDGLLSKVVWNTKDNQAVNAEAIRVAGEIGKSELERRQKEREDAEAEKKAAIKAADEALKASEKDLAEKSLNVDLATAKVAAAEALQKEHPSDANSAALSAAKLELDQARIRFDDATRAAEKARKERDTLKNAMDNPKTASNTKAQPATPVPEPGTTFWGPVLYEVVEDTTTVKLVAVDWLDRHGNATCSDTRASTSVPTASEQSADGGVALATAGPSKQLLLKTNRVPDPAPAVPAAPKVKGGSQSMPWPTGEKTLSITLYLDAPFDTLKQSEREILRRKPTPAPLEKTLFTVVTTADQRSITFTINERLPKGTYQLVAPFTYAKNQPGSATLDLEIEK